MTATTRKFYSLQAVKYVFYVHVQHVLSLLPKVYVVTVVYELMKNCVHESCCRSARSVGVSATGTVPVPVFTVKWTVQLNLVRLEAVNIVRMIQ